MGRWWRLVVLPLATLLVLPVVPAGAADTVNVYSIWTDNWNRQLFPEFEKATGIKVNFVRLLRAWETETERMIDARIPAQTRLISTAGNPRQMLREMCGM